MSASVIFVENRIWMWAIRISDESAASLEASELLRQKAELASNQVGP